MNSSCDGTVVNKGLTGSLSVRLNPFCLSSMTFSVPFKIPSGSFLRVVFSSLSRSTGMRFPLFASSWRSLGSRETKKTNTSRAVSKTRSFDSPPAARSASQACITKSADRALRVNCESTILLTNSTALSTPVSISLAEGAVNVPSSLDAQFRFCS